MEAFIGTIILFAGNFPPRGWAFCDGRILSIYQNTALFSILGITYGGDGMNTFALPDLRGRVPVHVGASQGPGVDAIRLGEAVGANSAALQTVNVQAQHSDYMLPVVHGVGGSSEAATTMQPSLGLNYIICLEGIFPSQG